MIQRDDSSLRQALTNPAPGRPAKLLGRRRFALVAAALAAGAGTLGHAQTPATKQIGKALPTELQAFTQSGSPWSLQGSGVLRFFGFKAYDAHLWRTAAGPNPLFNKSVFALEIDYNTAIKGEEIVNVSLIEMARLRNPSAAQVASWTKDMQRSFPSVKAGDRLTGVFLPKQGVRFFLNGRLLSEVNDIAFGEAFFAIWLDEGTKRAELRRALLGMPPVAAPAPPGSN